MLNNKTVRDIYRDIYNFWLKYCDKALNCQSPEWENIVADAKGLMEKYNCPLVINMVNDLITELEQRCLNIHSS